LWSHDFVAALTHHGRMLKILTLIDESTCECLALRVGRSLGSYEVIETLADVMQQRAIPQHLRTTARNLSPGSCVVWLGAVGTVPLYIEPGSP
jgi:putative transposase